MTRLPLLCAVALVPFALQAATPSKSTSRAVGDASTAATIGGAPIPGLCMLSQTEVLTKAKVALAADARLKQIQQQVETELRTEQTTLNVEARTLVDQSDTADFKTRQAALQARAKDLAQKSELRQRELLATRQKTLARISTEAQPIVQQAFLAHSHHHFHARYLWRLIIGHRIARNFHAQVSITARRITHLFRLGYIVLRRETKNHAIIAQHPPLSTRITAFNHNLAAEVFAVSLDIDLVMLTGILAEIYRHFTRRWAGRSVVKKPCGNFSFLVQLSADANRVRNLAVVGVEESEVS